MHKLILAAAVAVGLILPMSAHAQVGPIVAGGVLTVPDYTRTCTCSYQNQASVGLIHMPEADLWTFTTKREVRGPIRQVGIGLGAAFPPINLVAKPFICPNGNMRYEQATSNPLPGTT